MKVCAATAQWQGKVQHPKARTTADCENAAQAVLELRYGALGGDLRGLMRW